MNLIGPCHMAMFKANSTTKDNVFIIQRLSPSLILTFHHNVIKDTFAYIYINAYLYVGSKNIIIVYWV
jgi:hypothetical protein